MLSPGERKVVPNGIKTQLYSSINVEIQIRPRSGLAAKKGITVVNTPGTVDYSYRGELMTILLNTGHEDFVINPGDRISQMVICPIYKPDVFEINEVNETDRGDNGFGSSGVL